MAHNGFVATVRHGDFEWDSGKALENLAKHDVSFEEAATATLDPLALDLADDVHPDRFLTIGMSIRERLLLVVVTERGERTRIISARRANADERRLYEEG